MTERAASPGRRQHRERFMLTVEDLDPADPVPTILRLRALLKMLRRGYRFRCVEVRPELPMEPGR